VHAAARICFAAHGGQIVLSAPVREELLKSPPDEDVAITSLGAWRFRGLPESLVMFQAQAPDLSAAFPPLRSAVQVDPAT
jgi:class 3 adenylate cyclase